MTSYDVRFTLFLYLLDLSVHRCYSAEAVIHLFSNLEWNATFYPKGMAGCTSQYSCSK